MVRCIQKSKRNLGEPSDVLDCGVVSIFLSVVDFQTWYVSTLVCLHVYMYVVCMYACMCVRICVCVYIYIGMYVCVHA